MGVEPPMGFNVNNPSAIEAFFSAVRRCIAGDSPMMNRLLKFTLTNIEYTTTMGQQSAPTPRPITSPTAVPVISNQLFSENFLNNLHGEVVCILFILVLKYSFLYMFFNF
jgi:hypothetical protein